MSTLERKENKMSEVDDNTQANIALTLEEKITDRVRKALVEVLHRKAGDVYVQDMINERIRTDVNALLSGDFIVRDYIKQIVKQTVAEQMNKY
jgi:hypothetical protein